MIFWIYRYFILISYYKTMLSFIDLHRPTLRKLRAEDMFETWVSNIFKMTI